MDTAKRPDTQSRSVLPLAPPLPPGGLATLMAPQSARPTKRWRVAYLVSHPIQYQAPLLRWLESHSAVDLTTLFLSDLSVGKFHDEGFGRDVDWSDVDLLSGYRHRFLEARGKTDRLSLVRPFTRGIEAELAKGEFDALWVHGYAHQANLRAIRAARRLGIPVLLRGESLLLGRREKGFRAWLRDRLVPHVLASVDGVLSIGTANRDFYRAHGVAPERIFSAPYAVDNARFQRQATAAAATREELRAELALDPRRPVVLYASKLSARKRPLDLVAAFHSLHRRSCAPRPYLLIAGDGPQRGEVEAAARRLEQELGEDCVRMLGFATQTELPRLYDLCDVLVLPSSYEPWGLVVNECMNAARPVVVSDRVGSGLDLVDDGRTGRIFPHGNTDALADALGDVLQSREHARALGRAALERVQSLDFNAVATGLERALERLVPAQ